MANRKNMGGSFWSTACSNIKHLKRKFNYFYIIALSISSGNLIISLNIHHNTIWKFLSQPEFQPTSADKILSNPKPKSCPSHSNPDSITTLILAPSQPRFNIILIIFYKKWKPGFWEYLKINLSKGKSVGTLHIQSLCLILANFW